MTTRLFRNSLFAAFAVGLALAPAAASASGGITASAGQGSLTGRVAMTVPVTVSCSAFWDPATQQLINEAVFVSVEQASGNQIARGSGTVPAPMSGMLPFPCDGSTTTIPVSILADPTGPPFHGGTAVVTGQASAAAGTSCGFPGCYYNFVGASGSFGPQQIKVH